VPYNQPGLEANTLLSGSFHAAARISAAAAEDTDEAAVATVGSEA
jgi:hypothetical protein